MYKVLVFERLTIGNEYRNGISQRCRHSCYFVQNDSGQDPLIISQGSGANVTVGNGESAVIYCDGGAGSGAAVSELIRQRFELWTSVP